MVTYSTSCCPINGDVRWSIHLALIRGSLGFWLLGTCFVLQAQCGEIPEECKNILSNTKLSCCQFPSTVMDENEPKIFKECMEKYTKDISSASSIDKNLMLECVEECFFNTSGLLNPDKTLNPEKVRADALKGIDKADEWTTVIDDAVTKCLATSVLQLSPNSTCTSGSKKFGSCMLIENYLNCPSQKWTNSDDCTVQKLLMEKCKDHI